MIVGVSSIGNVTAFDVPPHGLTTVIEAAPGLAMRAADTVAVSCVEETNVVVSAAPFQFTIEVEMKFWANEDTFIEVHRQRAYDDDEIRAMLKKAGFTEIEWFHSYTLEKPRATSDRVHYACRKK